MTVTKNHVSVVIYIRTTLKVNIFSLTLPQLYVSIILSDAYSRVPFNRNIIWPMLKFRLIVRPLWIGALCAVVLAIGLLLFSPWQQSIRVAFGLPFVFLLPGFLWSYVFWPGGSLPYVERTIISILLGVMFVPLMILLGNYVGLPINGLVTYADATVLSLIGFLLGKHN
jgi:hypothetical protein